jgi:hypothetical protein
VSVTTISLIESLLLHDRPAAWWGLDTADPLTDDAVFGTTQLGYTLTALATPTNSASLHTRGDTGASGCRDFNGSTGGYFTAGSVTADPEGPPPFHAAAVPTAATSALATVVSPGGIAVGDLLLYISLHTTPAATVTTAPAGYTQVGTTLNAGTHAVAVYRKTAVQADTVPQEVTLVWNSSAANVAAMLVYRGCDTSVANLIFDSGQQATSSATFHSTTTETHPDGSRQLVLWSRDFATTLDPFPTGKTERTNITNGNLQLIAVDYEKETDGSGFRTATTNAATTLGAILITFGSPRKVLDNALDTLAANFSCYFLCNPDTLSGTDTVISKHQAYHVDFSGTTLRFRYRDGGGVDRTVTGPTLSTGTTQRVWVRDDGTNIHFTVNGTTTTAARTGTAGYTVNSNRVCIAHAFDGAATSAFYDGRLDEPAIFTAFVSNDMVAAHDRAATLGLFGDFLTADRTGKYPRGKIELAIDSRPSDRCHAFTDVSTRWRKEGGLSYSRQRNDPMDRMEAGTFQATFSNRDRFFDGLLPRRVIRFRSQVAVDLPVLSRYRGYTEAPKFARPASGKDSVVRLTATNAFKALSMNKVRETKVRPTEFAGLRLEALLEDVAGIRRYIDTGVHEVIGDDLQGVTLLEHAQAVAETDGGIFFADALDTAVFQSSGWRSVNERTVRATYGWPGTTATFRCDVFEPEVDESRLYTGAVVTPASGNVQRATNDAAALEFFPLDKEVSTLHALDADALAMAQHISDAYSVPLERVRELKLQPAAHTVPATMWSMVLSHEVSHRIKTIEDPVGGAEVAREHFIEGVSETVGASDWRVSFSLSPVELEGNYFVVATSRMEDGSVISW